MPNIITHMVVGEMAGLSGNGALLGTALPDLNDMCRDFTGVRLAPAREHVEGEDILTGIRIHQETDSIYNAMPEKTDLLVQARVNFEEACNPIGRAAMRGCADAGTKMLLDGVLWHKPEVRKLYSTVREATLTDEITFAPTTEGDLLARFANGYFERSCPLSYQDPQEIATILQRRFDSRKRRIMAFDHAAIPAVTDVLAKQYERLLIVGGHIVSKLVEGLAATNGTIPLCQNENKKIPQNKFPNAIAYIS